MRPFRSIAAATAANICCEADEGRPHYAAPEDCFGGPRHDGVLFERPRRGARGRRDSATACRCVGSLRQGEWLPIDLPLGSDCRIDVQRSPPEYTPGGGIAPAVARNRSA